MVKILPLRDEIPLDEMKKDLKDHRNSANKLDGSFTRYLIFCVVIACFGSFQMGWNLATLNVPEKVILNFYSEVHLERNNKSTNISISTLTFLKAITGGVLPLGGAIGGCFCGVGADYFGRRNAVIYTNVFVGLAAVLNISSKYVRSYEMLIVGRFLSGLICGLFSGLVPLYLNEISPLNLRSFTGTLSAMFIDSGILAVNICGLVLGTDSLWPLLFVLTIGISSINLGLFFAVESPKYLYFRNKKTEANFALEKLRGPRSQLVKAEIENLEVETSTSLTSKECSWKDMLTVKCLVRPTILVIVIHLSQILSGITAITYYSSSVFKTVVDSNLAEYASIAISAFRLITTVLVVSFSLVERLGRKKILLIGMTGMCISEFLVGTTILLYQNIPALKWIGYLTVISVFIYVFFFAISLGPIPFLIVSELFQSNSRGKALSIAVLVNWLADSVVTFLFPIISEIIGPYSFMIFGVFLILLTTLVLFLMPETKNRTTDEIAALFNKEQFFHRKQ